MVQARWSYLGRSQQATVAFRIDGRGADGYRVDVKTLSCMPWEAIDGGDLLPTLAACKALVTRWIAASAAQQTLTPRL